MSLSEAQLRERKQGIGSSEVAAVVGMNPNRGPHDVYAEKLDLCEPFTGNDHTEYGKIMEPVCLDQYEAMTGVKLDRTNETISHPEAPWMKATVDAKAPDRIVEAKATSIMNAHRWGDEGSDEVPDEYLCQVAWQMAVLDIDHADIIVALPPKFIIYHIHRQMDFERWLIAKARDFWFNHVLTKTPPPVDGSEACFQNLGRRNNGKVYLEGVAELDHLMTAAAAAKALKEKADAEEKLIRAQIMERVGDDWKGYKGDAGSIYWVERKPSIKEDPKAMLSLLREKGVTQEELDSVYREVPGSKYVTFRPSKEK